MRSSPTRRHWRPSGPTSPTTRASRCTHARWGTSGRARFFSSRHGWASSLLGDRGRAIPGRWITVEVLCLDDLLARIGHERVGLLKLDIEGAEWELFASCRLRDRATVVMGELHDREQRREDALSPGLDDLSVRFTDPPHATTFVAFRNYV